MKVLHAPVVIANQSVILAKALRNLGVEAISLQYYKPPLKYTADININVGRKRNFIKWFFTQLVNFSRFYNSYDIYHFHYGETLLPFFLDMPILKIFGKKIVFEYHGADIKPPFSYKVPFNFLTKIYLSVNQQVIKIMAKLFANAEIVTTPDLLDNAPGAVFIPVALQDSLSHNIPKEKNEKVVIVHAPTNRVKKGTSYIIEQIEKLKKEGLDIELDLVEGLSEKEARKHYERADIAIDQVLIGWYGLFSVEMMSLGKPVLCYIRKDLRKYAPGLPIVDSNISNLAQMLKILVEKPKLREELGQRGVEFVKKFHSSEKVTRRFVDIYKNL